MKRQNKGKTKTGDRPQQLLRQNVGEKAWWRAGAEDARDNEDDETTEPQNHMNKAKMKNTYQ